MREIKFRGKHLEPGGTWKYGSLVVCENGDCLIGTCKEYGPEERYMRNEVYPDSVGQYTGLKDRNGKEIYEGDIVKSILILDNGIKLRTNIDIVEWNNEECSFMLTKNVRHFHNNLELEVIGNIYDNPELLEVIE